MVLVDHQIKRLCEHGLVTPYDESLVNPSSLDIRIGYSAMKDTGWGILDNIRQSLIFVLKDNLDIPGGYTLSRWADSESKKQVFQDIDFSHYTKESPYYLKANECLLVGTLESFNIPPTVSVELKLKSSRAREGLSHALAGWVDPGFNGVLTLEIKNYSTKHCVPIYPGLRIGQLIFHENDLPDATYEKGRYAGHDKVMGSMD